jgi:HD-like signal output (HDOD) protein
VLRLEIADGGGPVDADRDAAMELGRRITEMSDLIAPPPPFPASASQVLAITGDAKADLNELVGVVQRDAVIAAAILRAANSAAFAPPSPITTLRAAVHLLGMRHVAEVVIAATGDTLMAPERGTRDPYPELALAMYESALANAFTAGRLALDIPSARGERALLAGLLADTGRPIALRIVGRLIASGEPRHAEAIVAAAIDAVAPTLSTRAISMLALPEELRAVCLAAPQDPPTDARIAQLACAIGEIQRRSTRSWSSAADLRTHAKALGLTPLFVRSLFGLRDQELLRARLMFGTRPERP